MRLLPGSQLLVADALHMSSAFWPPHPLASPKRKTKPNLPPQLRAAVWRALANGCAPLRTRCVLGLGELAAPQWSGDHGRRGTAAWAAPRESWGVNGQLAALYATPCGGRCRRPVPAPGV